MLSKFGSKVSSRFGSLDPLIIFIVLAVIVGIFFPISGRPAEWFSTATVVAVAVLFFLYGARLSTREALDGLTNWRLHATILAFTFVLFPLIGVALRPVGMSYNPELYMGVLYLTLVPSTVQSSVAFTSIARGNVAGAIVSASASNVLGVVVTPALVMLLMSQRSGGSAVVAVYFGAVRPQVGERGGVRGAEGNEAGGPRFDRHGGVFGVFGRSGCRGVVNNWGAGHRNFVRIFGGFGGLYAVVVSVCSIATRV